MFLCSLRGSRLPADTPPAPHGSQQLLQEACRDISLPVPSLQTLAQRFPEAAVISLCFVSLGIAFSWLPLTSWPLIYWFVETQPLHCFTIYSSEDQWECQLTAFMSHQGLPMWHTQTSAEKMKVLNFRFFSESQEGVLSSRQAAKNKSSQVLEISYPVTRLWLPPHLWRLLSSKDFAPFN